VDALKNKIQILFTSLRNDLFKRYHRVLPFGDYFNDRWEKAKFLGFGEGSSIYDNVLVLENVKVGANTWIGPNVILDGSGELVIGSNCSISAGVQIYTHDSVQWAISGGTAPYEYAKTIIGDNCYIGPNVIIQKGVTIGKSSIIGANSFVNKNVPENSKAYGTPITILKDTALDI
jgi:acetyltransferase-like isoleucine patch superfamily enzyme